MSLVPAHTKISEAVTRLSIRLTELPAAMTGGDPATQGCDQMMNEMLRSYHLVIKYVKEKEQNTNTAIHALLSAVEARG